MEYEKRTKIIAISTNYNDNLHDFFREKLNREILRVNLLTKSNDKDIYEVTYLEEKKYFQHKNGNVYLFEKELKLQTEDVWNEYILYSKNNEFFLRTKEEFNQKFKEII